jgi:ATP-binding cassette subfamily B multidrug efflux pump
MESLQHLNKYFFRYKKLLVGGFLFVILSNIFAVLPARLIRYAIDMIADAASVYRLLDGFPEGTGVAATLAHNTFIFLLVILAVIFLRGFFLFLMRQTIIVMSRHIEYDLKNEIYAQYQALSLAFYRRSSTGDLMNRISEDVSRVRMYLGPAVMYTINLVFLFVFIIASMIQVNPRLTLYVLLPLPVLSVSIYFVSDLMNRKSEAVQAQQSRLSTFVQETFSGVRILKAFVREDQFTREFTRESNVYKNRSLELARINALFFPLMLLLIGLSTILTVYAGGADVMRGKITMGNVAEFVIYVNMLTWPVASLGWVTSLVQRAAASQQRINEFLHQAPDIVSPGGADRALKGRVEFRNVSFVYPDSGIRALDRVSFRVEPGQTLAILGSTGSGKTTIANLLLRMYDVTEGEVLLDDLPVTQWPLQSLRHQVGYVPQDVFLFSDTLENNIAFGLESGPDAGERRRRVEEAARVAGVYENILEFPAGFETLIGERGVTLSGGQKQRVSIARAVIKKPPVLLFDDCLSAVDTQTEERILANIRQESLSRTTLIISHRVSTVKHAHHILVLDNGSIVEQGDHAGLLARKGVYAGLFEKQQLEQEQAGA